MENEHQQEYKLKLKNLQADFPKVFQKICCPNCNEAVAASNININDQIAKCDPCAIVFPFEKDIAHFKNEKDRNPVLVKPEGIDVFRFKDDIDFTITQPNTQYDVLTTLYSVVFTFLLFIFYSAGKISFIFPLAMLAIMVYFIGRALNKSKHKIHINIDNRKLDIAWRPKKFNKDKSYDISEIDQVYIKKFGTNSAIYIIVNGLEGQKHVMLTYVNNQSKARFLEQQIETFLGIQDRAVPEENS